jgi:uncharacterized protein
MKLKPTIVYCISLLLLPMLVVSQTSGEQAYRERVLNERASRDQVMRDPSISPLTPAQMQRFTALSYFEIDPKYRVNARITIDSDQETVALTMTDNSSQDFIKYGSVTFSLDGKSHTLDVFIDQNQPEFRDNPRQLFIPFKDGTSGEETSDNGRYLTIKAPEQGSDVVELDFNKAYDTYNAYNRNTISFVPPAGNILEPDLAVGQRKFEDRL